MATFKKTFFLIVAVISFPVLVFAADFWSFGSDSSGGYSGGYVGQDFSAGFDANGNFRIGSGTDGAASLSGTGRGFFSQGGWNLGSVAGFGLPGGSIYNIVANILLWLLGIFGFCGVIGFVISGIQYLISAGDSDMAERAKTTMKYSIIGVIVGLVGVVVIQAIDAALRGFGQF